MIVIMESRASDAEIADVVQQLCHAGCHVRRSGVERVILGVSGAGFEPDPVLVTGLPGVEEVSSSEETGHLVSRSFQRHDSQITFANGTVVGGERIAIIAGPCSVKDRDTLQQTAEAVKRLGAQVLRGGAFKPRTSPYSFQGLGEEGLFLLREAADANGLLVISEVMEPSQIHLAAHYCDILQVGARNVQNFPLLRELGRARRPVMLKRGPASTLDEWLAAAEYLAVCGNVEILLCERGIRTFETATRNTMDLNAVPALKERTHLPVVADPSHGTGRRDYVIPMARASIAAGADAIMVEVDIDPSTALSDGAQTLTIEQFGELMRQVRPIADAVGRAID